MEEYVQVVTTTESREKAEKIAKALVEARLVACAQFFGPIVSTYWWKDQIEMEEEWLCIMKTTQGIFNEVEEAIKAIHSYETPEIVALPIAKGSDDYLRWLQKAMPLNHYLDLRTYKRNRSVIIVKMTQDDFMVIENGFFKDRFQIKAPKLQKLLKSLLKKEFPRSRKIRLYAKGEFNEAEASG